MRPKSMTQTVRYLGKCGRGHKFAMDIVAHEVNNPDNYYCPCGAIRTMNRLNGRLSETKCSVRCTSATGPNCECQCAGKAHGSDHI